MSLSNVEDTKVYRQIRVQIEGNENRSKMISALAESGYKVWVETINLHKGGTKYYVCFEMSEQEDY